MRQFDNPNRQKAIKKLVSISLGNILAKNIELFSRAIYFYKKILHFVFQVTKRIVTFYIEVLLMTNLIYSPMMPNEQKISSQ